MLLIKFKFLINPRSIKNEQFVGKYNLVLLRPSKHYNMLHACELSD